MSNIEKIWKEWNSIGNQFVLHNMKVYKFVGITKDKWDYYYLLFDEYGIHHISFLFRLYKLKDKLDDSDYNDIEKSWNMNININWYQEKYNWSMVKLQKDIDKGFRLMKIESLKDKIKRRNEQTN